MISGPKASSTGLKTPHRWTMDLDRGDMIAEEGDGAGCETAGFVDKACHAEAGRVSKGDD